MSRIEGRHALVIQLDSFPNIYYFQYVRSFISCSCSLISSFVSEGHPELSPFRIRFELKVMMRFYFSSLVNIFSIVLVSLGSEGLFLGFCSTS